MKRESMVFYDSFFEAIKDLPPEEFKKCACGLFSYGLYGEVPETTGIEKTIYVLSKPLIDKNNQRWENSKKRTEKKNEKVVPAEETERVVIAEEAESYEQQEPAGAVQTVAEIADEAACPEEVKHIQTDNRKETAVRKEWSENTGTPIAVNYDPSVKDGTNMVFYEGTYKNVRLNVAEKCRIINEIGMIKYFDCVKYLSEYLHVNPTLDSGDHMEDILGWVLQRVDGKSTSG